MHVRAVPRPRRAVAVAVSLAATLALALGLLTPASNQANASTVIRNTCPLSALDVPSCGVLWGMYQPDQNYAPIESSIGRQLDIVKDYVGWQAGSTFPNAAAVALASQGRILQFSWSPQNFQTRAKISYTSITSGQYDKTVIDPEAAALKAFPHKVILDFGHEFDTKAHAALGTPAQYVAAYQHVENRLKADGVTNVIYAWVTTGYVPHASTLIAGYPGSAYVDWIGWDPYNWSTCHSNPWHTPAQTFDSFYDWVATQPNMASKPLMLGEYGSAPGSGEQAWYAAVPAALQALPKVKAVMQWDDDTVCDFRTTAAAATMSGFKAAGNSSYILGH